MPQVLLSHVRPTRLLAKMQIPRLHLQGAPHLLWGQLRILDFKKQPRQCPLGTHGIQPNTRPPQTAVNKAVSLVETRAWHCLGTTAHL